MTGIREAIHNIENFVGVFPNAASEEYCERCISRFNLIDEGLPGHGGRVLSRQEYESGVPQTDKDSDVYEITKEVNDTNDTNDTTEFNEIVSNATAFLYMTEDYSQNRLNKSEIIVALHILRDSIVSYLESSKNNINDIQQQEQQEGPS